MFISPVLESCLPLFILYLHCVPLSSCLRCFPFSTATENKLSYFSFLNPSPFKVTPHSLVFFPLLIFCFKLIVPSSSSHYCPMLCLLFCACPLSSSSLVCVLVQPLPTEEKKSCFLAKLREASRWKLALGQGDRLSSPGHLVEHVRILPSNL